VLVLVGFMESPRIALDVRELLRRSLRVEAISVGSRQDLEALVETLGSGAFRPEIDRIFSFRDVPAALEHLRRGAHVGKVVVEIEDR
jgi:D-arabinose 1-dehydrogenase-like Zn-dependent alcohol dehydrogenase